MSEREVEIAVRMAEAFKVLPEKKKEWWLGYAEGVIDMDERQRQPDQASASA